MKKLRRNMSYEIYAPPTLGLPPLGGGGDGDGEIIPLNTLNGANVFAQITSGVKLINEEAGSLNPSAPVFLYEIDLSEIYPQTSLITTSNQPINQGVLRVYNDYNLFNIASIRGRISWQGNFYYPFPIAAEGFDISAAGTLPNPRVVFANASPDDINNSFYKYIRMQVQSLGDLAGCKFTRIKTFLKYLHPSNFENNVNPYNVNGRIFELELPKDIFYIDRKSLENKTTIEYSLASILDLENVNLPSRTVLATKCPFQYRGEGCLYEYHKRITDKHSGVYSQCRNVPVNTVSLPLEAPPVSTDNDEVFLGEVLTGRLESSWSDQFRFSGIRYGRVGTNGSTWTNTSFTSFSQANLIDNNYSTVGAVSAAAICSIAIQLPQEEEVTTIRINSSTSIVNNFNVDFSMDNGSTWRAVNDISGAPRDWMLSGRAAGTYVSGWPSVGRHRWWRIRTTNSAANTNLTEIELSGQYRIGDSGAWNLNNRYHRGEFVFLEKLGIKYYYVCLSGHTSNPFNSPPNRIFWGSDHCSKSISACRQRWQTNPYFRPVLWPISRGGWSQHFYGMMLGNFNLTYAPVGDLNTWPRRAWVENNTSSNKYAWGLPKDYTGQYLNGFLPFGGFPGVNRRS